MFRKLIDMNVPASCYAEADNRENKQKTVNPILDLQSFILFYTVSVPFSVISSNSICSSLPVSAFIYTSICLPSGEVQ